MRERRGELIHKLSPRDIAQQRAGRLPDPLDRRNFMEAFTQSRIAEARGDDRLYQWYRAALECGDSVRVAGLIEGAASYLNLDGKTR